MTSPRQRKKRLIVLNKKQKQEELLQKQNILKLQKEKELQQQVAPKPVEAPPAPVVDSAAAVKAKKSKPGLVELKSQDQVVEQVKEEVKTPTKE